MEFEHILIATDLSEAARPAVNLGLGLAERVGARVSLLTVLPLPEPLPIYPLFGRRSTAEKLFAEVREHAEQELANLAERVRAEHPSLADRLATEVTNGRHVADEVLAAAERVGADLVVLGTHGHRGWRRFVLGSVAESVVRQATGAVLTCPPAEASEESAQAGPVVVAVDLGSAAEELVRDAARLAVGAGVALRVVHAVEPLPVSAQVEGVEWLPTDDERLAAAQAALDRLLEATRRDDLEMTGQVLIGRASDQVSALADSESAQCLVLGQRGLRGASELLLGSTADRLLRVAPCPVLSLRS